MGSKATRILQQEAFHIIVSGAVEVIKRSEADLERVLPAAGGVVG